ncbi:transglycosylase SLT domain-containing protein [candidate division WOR-3 bacterium]|nr:transglycosylase SLT domain-containing protein [candidate division WOR-3 bacterium]
MRKIFSRALLCAVLTATCCTTYRQTSDTSQYTATEDNVLYVESVSADTLASIMLTIAEEQFTQANEALKSSNYILAHQIANDGMRYLLDIPIEDVQDPFLVSRYNINLRRLSSAQIRAANSLWGYPVIETTDHLLIPIDIDASDRLKQALNYWTNTSAGRNTLIACLRKSGKYLPLIEEVLEDYNLPHDIAFLPIIESGYSPGAVSPASAVGIWQFIPGTARNFGLSINNYVDERRDPYKSSIAAARYLSSLYERFGDWKLAFAAYNCGEGTVERAINNAGTNDFWKLSLPNETMTYVPWALAVMLVAREPELYGMSINYEDPMEYDTVHLNGPVDLSVIANSTASTKEKIKELNPHILQSFTPPGEYPFVLKIPSGTREVFRTSFDVLPDSLKYLSNTQITVQTAPVTPTVVWRSYTVRSGDTLSRIARRLGVAVEDLKRWNPNDAGGRYLQIGASLRYQIRR